MLDLFTIFSKGGIVLWCFQGTSQLFTPSVNALIKTVILQERGGNNSFSHDALTLKYKLDNEFELTFVVAYQKILQLSYVDKFLNDIQIEFRNRYKDDLQVGRYNRSFDFTETFMSMLKSAEEASRAAAQKPRKMKTFEQSDKSRKTVASMIENKKETPKQIKAKEAALKKAAKENVSPNVSPPSSPGGGSLDESTRLANIERLKNRGKKKEKAKDDSSSNDKKKKGKESRMWDVRYGGNTNNKSAKDLDFSSSSGGDSVTNGHQDNGAVVEQQELSWVGQMKGGLKDMEPESSSEDEEEEVASTSNTTKSQQSSGFGMFNVFKNLVSAKTLTHDDIQPIMEKMKDHLIAKNVAADIAQKLCDSVASKLEGKVLGTFSGVTSTVKTALQEACIQLLSPRRRVDILRDAMEAKQQRRPYVITFCGVNGVGKSTNLAKVCFWLVENGFRVLIAACDTFRAGAVEQLRTHTRKLNALHPPESHNGQQAVQLYEKGYGKDAAGIAMEAINCARDTRIDVVLIDTAGRMQDNEPLMRALAKLIKVNTPDLVLFVGEALVGNEAVDQLTKFNQALADHSNMENPRIIDGILLTKFDTIDDKVGAAISMTYITGQPIVFVGTGQTYTDLKNLNAKAVVHSLLKS
ncbi:unnamed protein product [Owenia fusiformis]|uniref:Uncharacterized protein n=1 Tax=Owenia fusiformis TaxID=6347 RepID=A0A8J1XSP6_OWEFU|nr:unnamed protein product [Owenia fusiformis]